MKTLTLLDKHSMTLNDLFNSDPLPTSPYTTQKNEVSLEGFSLAVNVNSLPSKK